MDVDGVLIGSDVSIVSIEMYRLNMVTAAAPLNMPTERICVDNGRQFADARLVVPFLNRCHACSIAFRLPLSIHVQSYTDSDLLIAHKLFVTVYLVSP